MTTNRHALAMVGLSGGELALVLIVLLMVFVLVVALVGAIALVIKATQSPRRAATGLPPEIETHRQRSRDLEHLKVLSIFHFVLAGLACLGMAFTFVHWLIMHAFMTDPEFLKMDKGTPPPAIFFQAFVWFYVFMGLVLLVACLGNLVSGIYIQQKRNRVFSIVIAGLDCVQFPFGTALGIFTIIVLSRESVRRIYAENGPPSELSPAAPAST